MKIEKLNDNQIRCILDKHDLDQRQLQLSELAYGSTKAKALFRDMMEQASAEFGFEVDNIPLMIEAIPVSLDCLILVVTKVEDPDELDTRFSRFSSMNIDEDDMEALEAMMEQANFPYDKEDVLLSFGAFDDSDIPSFGDSDEGDVLSFDDSDDDGVLSFGDTDDSNVLSVDSENSDVLSVGHTETSSDTSEHGDSAGASSGDDAIDILGPFSDALAKAKEEFLRKKKAAGQKKPVNEQIFGFDSLDAVMHLSSQLLPFYQGGSVLYKDRQEKVYYLVLKREDTDSKLFQRACTICTDHGEAILSTYASLAYFKEHFQVICREDALQTLNHLM